MQKQTVVVRFCGDSGDGMQLTGNMFSSLSAILGNEISTLPDTCPTRHLRRSERLPSMSWQWRLYAGR